MNNLDIQFQYTLNLPWKMRIIRSRIEELMIFCGIATGLGWTAGFLSLGQRFIGATICFVISVLCLLIIPVLAAKLYGFIYINDESNFEEE